MCRSPSERSAFRCPLQCFYDAAWCERGFVEFCTYRRKGVAEGVADCCRWSYGAAFTHALYAEPGECGGGHHMADLEVGDLRCAWQEVICKSRGEGLAVCIVDTFLLEGGTDTLRDAADDLPVDDHWIDNIAAIFHHRIV